MIKGEVTSDHEAVIDVRVRSLDRRELTVKAVVDTGYSDYLVLPSATIAALELPLLGPVEYTLADNSDVMMDLFGCEVLWDGDWRFTPAAGSRGGALVGMGLMAGSELRIMVREGGEVTIQMPD